LQSPSLERNVFSKSAFSNVLETSRDHLSKEFVSNNSLLEELCYQVAVNDSRALLWLRPKTIAERVAREGGSTHSAFLEMCALVSKEPSAGRSHCPIL
jgi:hypothetical protein